MKSADPLPQIHNMFRGFNYLPSHNECLKEFMEFQGKVGLEALVGLTGRQANVILTETAFKLRDAYLKDSNIAILRKYDPECRWGTMDVETLIGYLGIASCEFPDLTWDIMDSSKTSMELSPANEAALTELFKDALS